MAATPARASLTTAVPVRTYTPPLRATTTGGTPGHLHTSDGLQLLNTVAVAASVAPTTYHRGPTFERAPYGRTRAATAWVTSGWAASQLRQRLWRRVR